MSQRKKQNQRPSIFAQQIINHWQDNFPKQAKALEKHGMLLSAAESAAERAGIANEQALSKGLNWSQAQELSVELWGTPPNL